MTSQKEPSGLTTLEIKQMPVQCSRFQNPARVERESTSGSKSARRRHSELFLCERTKRAKTALTAFLHIDTTNVFQNSMSFISIIWTIRCISYIGGTCSSAFRNPVDVDLTHYGLLFGFIWKGIMVGRALFDLEPRDRRRSFRDGIVRARSDAPNRRNLKLVRRIVNGGQRK